MVVHVFSVLALWLLVSAVGLITFSALAEEHVKQFGNERYRNMQQLSSLQHRRSLVSEVATTSLFDHRTEQNHSQSIPSFPDELGQSKNFHQHEKAVASIPTLATSNHIDYVVRVGNLQDSQANPNQCSTTTTLSTCNVRSAWALCRSTINQVPCFSGGVVSCTVVLPTNSVSTIQGARYGTVVPDNFFLACSNDATMTLTLSMTSASSVNVATVAGDGSATSFYTSFSGSLLFSNVNINGFGDTAVSVTIAKAVSFNHVGFMNNSNPAVVLSAITGSIYLSSCTFVGNRAYGNRALSNVEEGGLSLSRVSNVMIIDTSFINNNLTSSSSYRGGGGGLSVVGSSNITISKSVFIGNTCTSKFGLCGGAMYVDTTTFLTIDDCTMRQNKADNGNQYNAAGAIYISSHSSNIAITSTSFIGNVGKGAIYINQSCSLISIGGTQPVTVTANNLPQLPATSISAPTGFRAKSFYTVFDADIYQPSRSGNDYILIGNYVYNSIPGIDGTPPLISQGQTVSVSMAKSDPLASIVAYIFPSVVRSDGRSAGVSFVGNIGGALYISDTVSNVFFFDVTFDGNVGNMGAVNIVRKNRFLYFYNVVFKNNINNAITNDLSFFGGNGGAISIQYGNSNIQLFDCSFLHNHAVYGGAVYLGSGNPNLFSSFSLSTTGNQILFVNIIADGNIAQVDGGWLFSHFLNSVIISNSSIYNNVAKQSGGAVYLYKNNMFSFAAYWYYIPVTSSAPTIDKHGVVFAGNHAGRDGGAIYSGQANLISNCDTMSGCQAQLTFVNNTCGNQGAGIAAFSDSTVAIAHTIFDSQHASGFGGAMALSASTLYLNIFVTTAIDVQYFYKPVKDSLISNTSIIMSNNRATSGSALYLVLSSIAYINGPVLANNNECNGHGGTIYWNALNNIGFANIDYFGHTSTLAYSDPSAFNVVQFKNNILPAGMKDIATQTTKLSNNIKGAIVNVTTYGSNLQPAPSFSLLDVYGNLNVTDSSSIVSWNILGYSCNGRTGYFSGVSSKPAVHGIATFDQLSALCYPGGHMTVNVTVQPSGLVPSYSLTQQLFLTFRDCYDGEVLTNDNSCLGCPDGSYSVRYSLTATCEKCPEGASGCTGGNLAPAAGYWRLTPYSTVMLKCPWPFACAGDDSSSASGSASSRRLAVATPASSSTKRAATCAFGYQGPLCAVCIDSFYFSSSTQRCLSCSGQGSLQLAILIFVPLVMLGLLAYLALFADLSIDDQFTLADNELTLAQDPNLDNLENVVAACGGSGGGHSREAEWGQSDAQSAAAQLNGQLTGGSDIDDGGCGVGKGDDLDTAKNNIEQYFANVTQSNVDGGVGGVYNTTEGVNNNPDVKNAVDSLRQAINGDTVDDEDKTGREKRGGKGNPQASLATTDKNAKEKLNKKKGGNGGGDGNGDPTPKTAPCSDCGVFKKILRVIKSLVPEIKIVITVYQIVTTFPFALNLQYPAFVSKFWDAMSFVNFSALYVGSPQCYTKYDYVDKLLTVTIAPLAILGLLGVTFGFHLLYTMNTLAKQNSKMTKDEVLQAAKEKLVPRYVGLFLVITYLVLPSVTTIIFGTFNLVNIDPQNLAPGTPLYLRNDYSIANNSKRFLLGLGYAIAMIFVYPLAIPVIYFMFLWVSRRNIKESKPVMKLQPLPEDVEIVLKYTDGDASAASLDKVKKSHETFKGRISLWVDFYGNSRQLLDILPTVPKVAPGVEREGSDVGDTVKAGRPGTMEPLETDAKIRGNIQSELGLTVDRRGAASTGLAAATATRDNTPSGCCPAQCDDETLLRKCFSASFQDLITKEIGFLHKAYEGEFWFWEIVETARRLLLTAVVSVAGPGTVSQIIFGIFLSLVFASLYAHFQPFMDKKLDWLQEVAQYQVFITLFISLLIRTNALKDGVNDAFYLMALDGALIAANTLTPLALIVIRFSDWEVTKQNWSKLVAMCSAKKQCCARGGGGRPSAGEKEDVHPSTHSMVSWGVEGHVVGSLRHIEEGSGTITGTPKVVEGHRTDQFERVSLRRAQLPPSL